MEDNFGPDADGNIHHGDMILSPEQYNAEYGDRVTGHYAIAGSRWRWPNGGNQIKHFLNFGFGNIDHKLICFSFLVIPYRFGFGLSDHEKSKVKDVIARFNRQFSGCLQIK